MHESRAPRFHMPRRTPGPLTLCASAVLLFAGTAQGAGFYPCPLHSYDAGEGEAAFDSPGSGEEGAHSGPNLSACDCGLTCMEARTLQPLPGAGEGRAARIFVPQGAYPLQWALLPAPPRAPVPYFLPPANAPPSPQAGPARLPA